MLTLSEYQTRAHGTSIYPDSYRIVYPALGLTGEAGEVANKVKKLIRDGDTFELRQSIVDELGDVLWYAAALASDLGCDLGDIALGNLRKLRERKERGALHGSGER